MEQFQINPKILPFAFDYYKESGNHHGHIGPSQSYSKMKGLDSIEDDNTSGPVFADRSRSINESPISSDFSMTDAENETHSTKNQTSSRKKPCHVCGKRRHPIVTLEAPIAGDEYFCSFKCYMRVYNCPL
eukprot:TRINITY_DN2923_c0_g1_i1.p1 TRINITY_DN2923_c0_g1~~TRINITY_DN2923_c0_g1_i1.p1  ORF type:complete len:130 (-),score=26.61 TRINITY_DN2923_c0_g1_i1:409-798(-)